ncbi:helix-turn-helix protein [Popillia japonica]|uniref:Helix-turn-helix protein n=1 Tax=Popillia japonica TaxID=7064 RepID=A0AAW1HVW1_POPJA
MNESYKNYAIIRDKFGFTDYKVCKKTGITTATMSNWKADKYTPKSDKLQKIADLFGVSLELLATGEEREGGETYYLNEETARTAQRIFENKELRLLFHAAEDAEPEDLEAVHAMLLALKRKERGETD